ncbi:DUF6164 family protein [Oceanobacter sp. 3_MG-2023]|uniref:DUF6164 family protein n=1 Tax=Oceanobacter sp. 3_MG-2023 TaxID=3062622 RepID=UPI00273507D1|nr:DUF6164 family protein [Oceanobacter sp. 3_MG-2023]MDP2506314.1 DUF6164 family protein [Oceanobacter sp. 3_MG-2023]
MARLLFKLNNVPDEEANAVRALLEQHDIPYYETHAGRWGIAVAAIWLVSADDYTEARSLIDQVQHNLLTQKQTGDPDQLPASLRQRFQERPVDFFLVVVAIAIIIMLTVWPFLTAFE